MARLLVADVGSHSFSSFPREVWSELEVVLLPKLPLQAESINLPFQACGITDARHADGQIHFCDHFHKITSFKSSLEHSMLD